MDSCQPINRLQDKKKKKKKKIAVKFRPAKAVNASFEAAASLLTKQRGF
jgi:hypothetical protein